MITAFAAGVAVTVASIAYVGYKYHSAKAALAAVKAEIALIEASLASKDPAAAGAVAGIVVRLKRLL